MSKEDLVYRLRKRAEIRAQIASRKSVQEGKADRLGELLLEAAQRIEQLEGIRNYAPPVPTPESQLIPETLVPSRDEIERLKKEGGEIRQEIARRVEPMKRGPFTGRVK